MTCYQKCSSFLLQAKSRFALHTRFLFEIIKCYCFNLGNEMRVEMHVSLFEEDLKTSTKSSTFLSFCLSDCKSLCWDEASISQSFNLYQLWLHWWKTCVKSLKSWEHSVNDNFANPESYLVRILLWVHMLRDNSVT